MDLGLRDKVAVVTASSEGLGAAVAQALAREGAKLAICSRSSDRISKTASDLKQRHQVDVLPFVCDVTDAESVVGFRDRVLEAFGEVNILFTNAGGPPPGAIQDVSPADIEKALQLNLMSAIHLVYAFLLPMKEKQWGRIITSTSISVKQPIPNLALSNISRVGVVAFVKSLAREFAPFGITANTVAPGYVMTERVKQLLDDRVKKEGIPYEEALEQLVEQIPAGRIGRPEEFGNLVAFLASELSGYINGETVLIDGAMYRGLY
jgi:3-oxoacyl-[acyl-carrier protein] reductase